MDPLLVTRPAPSNLIPAVSCSHLTPFRGMGFNGQRVAIRRAKTAAMHKTSARFRPPKNLNFALANGTCVSDRVFNPRNYGQDSDEVSTKSLRVVLLSV